jgi:hypothetical protein
MSFSHQQQRTTTTTTTVDVYYFPNSTMIDSTVVLTNPTMSTAIKSLPEILVRVLHNTCMFRFVKRPNNSGCSAEAQQYIALLEERKPTLIDLLRRNPSSRVCLKCTVCHRSSPSVIVPGSVSFTPLTVDGVISALKQRIQHLSESHSINLGFDFDRYHHILTVFLKEWIKEMKIKQNQVDTMIQSAGGTYLQQRQQQQQQQQQHHPQSYSVPHPNQYFYPMTILQQQQQQQQQRALELARLQSQQMNVFQQQQQQRSLVLLDRELDDLHWSILGYYTDDDENDDENDKSDHQDTGDNNNNVDEVVPKHQTPATKLFPDLYVPLDSRQIAQCRDEKLTFRDATSGERKREQTKAATVKGAGCTDRPCKIRLHGKIGSRDVVIPTRNCTRDVLLAVYNLIGNRRFMLLVLDYRPRYVGLSSEEEQTKLAKELVATIERLGGVFRNASLRDFDGTPVVLKSKGIAEAIQYTRFRLKNGFKDRDLLMKSEDHKTGTLSNDGNGSKVLKVHCVPTVGLIRGYLKWDSTSSNDNKNGSIKLEDLMDTPRESSKSKDPMAGDDGTISNDIVDIPSEDMVEVKTKETLSPTLSEVTTVSDESDASIEKDIATKTQGS